MNSKPHYISERRTVSGMTMKDPMDRETNPGVHQGEEIGKGVGGGRLWGARMV